MTNAESGERNYIDVEAARQEEYERTPILKYFAYDHLPPALADVSRDFRHLAWLIVEKTPPSAERATALRKLLEAKDAAVRSALDNMQDEKEA